MFFKKMIQNMFSDFGDDRILTQQEIEDQNYVLPGEARVLAVFDEPYKWGVDPESADELMKSSLADQILTGVMAEEL